MSGQGAASVPKRNPYFHRGSIDHWAYRLWHYPANILADIYPLSRNEYRRANLARRASYDYLTQTVEASAEWCRDQIRERVGESVEVTLQHTFLSAARMQIVPDNLGNDLASLARLRNMTVHENVRVDETLLVYDRLLKLALVGIATRYAVESATSPRLGQERDRPDFPVVVDSDYVRRQAERFWRKPDRRDQALSRLDREIHPPRYVIPDRAAT